MQKFIGCAKDSILVDGFTELGALETEKLYNPNETLRTTGLQYGSELPGVKEEFIDQWPDRLPGLLLNEPNWTADDNSCSLFFH